MRQLTFIKPGVLEWWEVAAPRLQADTDAIVRPLVVARCDLDLYIATGVVNYPGPFAFGHETIAEVVEAGPASAHVAPAVEAGPTVVKLIHSARPTASNQRPVRNSAAPFPTSCAYPSPITC
jgi:threonine dehydrogenase-like Zn-dependent dehydrogenase